MQMLLHVNLPAQTKQEQRSEEAIVSLVLPVAIQQWPWARRYDMPHKMLTQHTITSIQKGHAESALNFCDACCTSASGQHNLHNLGLDLGGVSSRTSSSFLCGEQ
jgi:hypothetical protein